MIENPYLVIKIKDKNTEITKIYEKYFTTDDLCRFLSLVSRQFRFERSYCETDFSISINGEERLYEITDFIYVLSDLTK